MTRTTALATSLFTALIAACGGPDRPAETAPAGQADAAPAGQADADPVVVCRTTVERQRACTDDYLPALVDLRVELDRPAGTADRVKAEGRDKIVTEARADWVKDTTDEKIAEQCSMVTKLPAERLKKEMPMTQACLARPDCKAFTECIIPIERLNLGGG
jgi:hypothetical protein